MNPVQFQAGLSMVKFLAQYGTEVKCRKAEAAYRFNRRFRLREMLPRLLYAMILCAPCTEPILRATTNYLG